MERIGLTVGKVIRQLEKKKEDNPEEKLKKYVTKKELRHIKLCNMKAGVMTINVDSSAWLYALSMKKRDLVNSLRLKDMRLRIGEID